MKGRKKIIAGLTTASLLLAECAVCNQSATVSKKGNSGWVPFYFLFVLV